MRGFKIYNCLHLYKIVKSDTGAFLVDHAHHHTRLNASFTDGNTKAKEYSP